MGKVNKFRQEIKDADFILKKVTGKGILDYGRMLWDLLGRGAIESLARGTEVEQRDLEDIKDCQILGADNFYSYNVFAFAVKIFRTENHPDRFPNPADKAKHEEAFKIGEGAIGRICEKRGWRIP